MRHSFRRFENTGLISVAISRSSLCSKYSPIRRICQDKNQNKDIINNVINATKETNTINPYNENISNNSTTTNANTDNYNVGNTSINKVETSTTANTNVNVNSNYTNNNNVYSNNEPSELKKQYQNNDLNK